MHFVAGPVKTEVAPFHLSISPYINTSPCICHGMFIHPVMGILSHHGFVSINPNLHGLFTNPKGYSLIMVKLTQQMDFSLAAETHSELRATPASFDWVWSSVSPAKWGWLSGGLFLLGDLKIGFTSRWGKLANWQTSKSER